jgi:hypothetical protein
MKKSNLEKLKNESLSIPKSSLTLSKHSILILKLIGLIAFVIQLTKQVNLITSFPQNLYVSKDDKVGFLLTKFVNGTRV